MRDGGRYPAHNSPLPPAGRPVESARTLPAPAWQVRLESVDYCPMGITIC